MCDISIELRYVKEMLLYILIQRTNTVHLLLDNVKILIIYFILLLSPLSHIFNSFSIFGHKETKIPRQMYCNSRCSGSLPYIECRFSVVIHCIMCWREDRFLFLVFLPFFLFMRFFGLVSSFSFHFLCFSVVRFFFYCFNIFSFYS